MGHAIIYNMDLRLQYRSIDTSTALLFDTMRGASALLVVLGHTVFYFFPLFPRFVRLLLNVADVAVLTFFVISGFMITSSILKQICCDPQQRFNIKHFARIRLLRLYPPLLVALLLTGVAYFCLININSHYESYWTPVQALLSPLFLLDMGLGPPAAVINMPLWSLSHEFWFYVVGALVAMALVSSCRIRLVCCLTLLTVLYSLGTLAWYLGLLVWCCGALIACFYHFSPLHDGYVKRVSVTPSLIASGVFCLTVIALWVVMSQEKSGLEKYAIGFFLAVGVGILVNQFMLADTAALLVNSAPDRLSWSQFVLYLFKRSLAITSTIAPFSYTLYVIHFPLLLVWFELTKYRYFPLTNPVLKTGIYLILIIAIAKYLGGLLEKPRARTRLRQI